MAGEGRDAFVFSPDAVVNDRDPVLFEILRTKFKVVTCIDLAIEPEKLFAGHYDLVNLDFDNYTIKKFDKRDRVFGKKSYHDIMDLAFQTATKFVVVNDCSVHGLKFRSGP